MFINEKVVLHHKRSKQIEYVIAEEENYLFNTYILSQSSTLNLQRKRNEQNGFAYFNNTLCKRT